MKVTRIGCESCVKTENHKLCNVVKGRPRVREKKVFERKEGLKFQCKDCAYGSETEKSFKRHVNDVHKNIRRYECTKCAHRTLLLFNMRCHVKSRHHQETVDIAIIDCNLCEERLPHEEHVYKHKDMVSDNNVIGKGARYIKDEIAKGTLKCSECDHAPFSSQNARGNHYKENHPGAKPFKCNECEYGSLYQQNLTSHINSHHKKVKLQCDKCSYSSTWNTAFHQHMRSAHGVHKRVQYMPRGKAETSEDSSKKVNVVKQNHLCEECGYSTNLTMNFKKHTELGCNQSNANRFKCNRCDFTSAVPSDIRKHTEAKHGSATLKSSVTSTITLQSETLTYKCNKCDFQTKEGSALREHIEGHDKK